VGGPDAELPEGVGAHLEEEDLVVLVELQDRAALPAKREGLAADLEEGLAAPLDLPRAGKRQR